jgi:Holliday junction resolvase RusA-like endonuclease
MTRPQPIDIADSLVIVLPLPPKSLHTNARVHFMAKSKATKAYRLEAAITAGQYKSKPRWENAHVHIVYFFKDERRRDKDNLLAWLKAAMDGIADAGIVSNDSGFVYMPVLVTKDPKRPRVEIEIVKVIEPSGDAK